MNAHSQVIGKALQLFLFVGMLLGLAVLRPAPVARAVNIYTNADCFVLSNEAPGNLISKLDAAGYGDYNLYDTLVAIKANANPSVDGILTPTFMAILAGAPVGAEIFTTQLKNVDLPGVTVEVCTNGIVQTVPVSGSSAAQSFPTIVSNISGVGTANFTYTTDDRNAPLATWQVTSGMITTIYHVFGVAWGQAMLYLPLILK